MRVLIIEGDRTIASAVARELAKSKLRCEPMVEPDAGRLLSEGDGLEQFDAVAIGTVRDAAGWIAQLRRAPKAPIVLSLLERRCSQTAVQHLQAGADDVLIKPVHGAEVEARLQAVRRRSHGHVASEVQVGRLTVYLDGRDPCVDGKRLRLSHREHAIFSVLALNVGKVVPKERIYELVYGLSGSDPLDKVIDVYICKLRKKLAESTGGEKYIETVYGRGYKFDAPAALEDEALPPPPSRAGWVAGLAKGKVAPARLAVA